MTKNEQVIDDVFKELRRAEKKFPGFPNDPIHAAAVVAEECGELQQAVLQWTYEGGAWPAVKKEAIQTAAMALRFLFHLRFMKTRPSDESLVSGHIEEAAQESPSTAHNSQSAPLHPSEIAGRVFKKY